MENLESNTDSTRKLASIKEILSVTKHPDANSLELVMIEGWQIVTRIGEAKVGDKVIYCEIDSMLPGNAEWLPPAVKARVDEQNDKEWYRLKTIKLRKEISQGLIVPILPSCKELMGMKEYDIDTDVTQELGIKKYEPPVFSGSYSHNHTNKIKVSNFPTHLVNKTDETRVQSCVKLFNLLFSNPYYITVKCDGTSGTFVIDPATNEFLVCSRNQIRPKPDDVNTCPYWKVAIEYDIENKLRSLEGVYAIQGEICGPNIQKNLLNLKNTELFVFNVVDIRDKRIVPFDDFIKITKELKLQTVPIEEAGDGFAYNDIKALLHAAEGKYKGTKNPREGLVIRSKSCDISFKAINNSYLLKYE